VYLRWSGWCKNDASWRKVLDTEMRDEQSYSLCYRSRRMEVWRWYWDAWLSNYWWWHLLIAAVVTWATFASLNDSFGPIEFFVRFLWITPIVIVLMAAWPQVAFKSQERILEVGPEGWSSRIAEKHGSKTWEMVASIQCDDDTISIVSASGNALLVPRSAFQSKASWDAFLSDIRRWHGGYKN
jgi:hypothetical protein